MRIATAAYRLLLHAFPANVRREVGDDMAAMFAMQMEQARRDGRSVSRLWLLAIADAMTHGLAERIGASERARGLREAKSPGLRMGSWMRAFRQDFKYALRVLARQPGVTFAPMPSASVSTVSYT